MRRRRATIDALLRQFRGLTRQAPVLCVVEDLQWADASTVELLDALMSELESLPVLVLVTFRPEYDVPWAGHACTTVMSLGRMGRRQSLALVEATMRGAEASPETAELIVRRADGIPLFIEELTEATLDISEAPARPTGDPELLATRIPDTLRDALMAKLDRSPAVRDLAQLAAAVGRDFDYPLVAAAAGGPAEEVRRGIELLAEIGLLQIRGELPAARCRFRHALIRDTAYASLTRQRRIALHASLARVLESRGAGAEPELVAHHLTEAGEHESALGYWERAGDRALAQAGQPEAAAHFGKAIALLQGLGQDERHARSELSLLMKLGQAQFGAFGGADPRTRATFQRASELSRRSGDVRDRCRAMYGHWIGLIISGQTGKGLEVVDELYALARDSGEDWVETIAHRLRGTAVYLMGDLDEARGLFREVMERHADFEGAPTGFAHNPLLTTPATLSVVEWARGYPDTAVRLAESGIAGIEHRSVDPNTLSYALVWRLLLFVQRREAEQVRQTVERLERHTASSGGQFWGHSSTWGRGVADVLEGNHARGLAALGEGRRLWVATGALQHLTLVELFAAEAALALRDLPGCTTAIDAAEALIAETEHRYYAAEAHRLRGRALAAEGREAEAHAQYRSAIDVARAQGGRGWQLRASHDLARALAEAGRREEALDVLAPIHDGFTEGFDTPDLVESGALLESLSGVPRPR